MSKTHYLSQEGFDNLKAELEELKTTGRSEVDDALEFDFLFLFRSSERVLRANCTSGVTFTFEISRCEDHSLSGVKHNTLCNAEGGSQSIIFSEEKQKRFRRAYLHSILLALFRPLAFANNCLSFIMNTSWKQIGVSKKYCGSSKGRD